MNSERKAVLAFAALSLAAAFGISCAAWQPMKYRNLWDLDFEQRSLFLAYYPLLSPDQRRALISKIEDGQALIKEWGLPEGLHRDPKNSALTGLEIQVASPDPKALSKGTRLHLRATLRYANGKAIEVTPDVRWSATPDTVRMKDNRLEYGCIHSDAVVSADFYYQKQGSLTLAFDKPVISLRLEKSEAAPAADVADTLPLKLVALCSDGTMTDVSCQATWQTNERFGRFNACGHLHLVRRTNDLDEKVPVSATYGGITVQRQFTPLMYPR